MAAWAIGALAAPIEYLKLTNDFALSGITQTYSSLVGLTQVDHRTPGSSVTLSGSANSTLIGQTAVSIGETGTVPNGSNTTSNAAFARGDLSTGELGVLASSFNLTGMTGNRGQAQAAMRDEITFSNITGSAQLIDVFYSLDGAMDLPGTFSAAHLGFRFCFGAHCALASNTILSNAVDYHFTYQSAFLPDGNYLTLPTDGWDSVSFDPGLSFGLNTFHGVYVVPEGSSTIDLYSRLLLDCGFDGVCDYSGTGKLSLDLPAGVSFTSASGVLLSAVPVPGGAVPEPGSLALALLGVASAWFVRRQPVVRRR
jgi:hypothetical protein